MFFDYLSILYQYKNHQYLNIVWLEIEYVVPRFHWSSVLCFTGETSDNFLGRIIFRTDPRCGNEAALQLWEPLQNTHHVYGLELLCRWNQPHLRWWLRWEVYHLDKRLTLESVGDEALESILASPCSSFAAGCWSWG